MLKIKFRVHDVNVVPRKTVGKVSGEDMSVTVDSLEVQLVAADSMHGSLRLDFTGADIEVAKATFQKDAEFTWTIETPPKQAEAPKAAVKKP